MAFSSTFITLQAESIYGSNDQRRGVSFVLVVLHPHSRGTISLASGDPLDRPLIDPKLLEDQRDKDVCKASKNIFHCKK